MRRLPVILGLVLAVVMVVSVACGGGTPTTTTTPPTTTTPTTAPTTTLPPVTIKFTYHNYMPPMPGDDPIWWLLDEVEKRMGGRVKFDVEKFFAQSLAKAAESLDAISTGVFDLAWLTPGYTPAKMPLWNVPNAIPLHSNDEGAVVNSMIDYYYNFPPAKAESDGLNIQFISATSTDSYEIMGNKRVQTLADIKGYRARTFGLSSKSWDKIGGVPVTMTFPEAFDSVQKGTLDGVLSPTATASWPSKIQEITKYMTVLGWCALPMNVVVNKDKWDTIPKDIQDMILEVGLETPEFQYANFKKLLGPMLEEFKAMGGVIDYMSEADRAEIQRLGGEPVWAEMKAELNAKGLPGDEAVDFVLKSVRDYEKAHPR